MAWNPLKSRSLTLMVAASTMLVAGLGATDLAGAACTDARPQVLAPSPAAASFAVYRPAALINAAFKPVVDETMDNAAIVGLWRFEARLDGAQNGLPDEFLFDWGLATWHDDGTEIQFSAARTPSSGDVCMGVWQQVGRNKFQLNHVALGLTPPSASGTYLGPAEIQYNITVDGTGNGYSGRFTLTQYAALPSDVPFSEFDQSQVVVKFTGFVKATRVTMSN